MIKIIEEGQTVFTIRCKRCRCLFEYEIENLNAFDKVCCPHCGNLCCHNDNIDFEKLNNPPQHEFWYKASNLVSNENDLVIIGSQACDIEESVPTTSIINEDDKVKEFDLEAMMDNSYTDINFIN